jgi:hypothetical protein
VVEEFWEFVIKHALDVIQHKVVHLWLIQLLLYQVTIHPPKRLINKF